MSSIRIKVQIGYEKSNDRFQKVNPPLKFVYLIEAPSHKTIHELTRTLQNYINQEFFYNIPIVQLVTHDGFILSKSDLCANVLKDNEQIVCIDMHTYTRENDASLNFDKLWLTMKQHDVSDNEEKSIEIGRTNSSKLFVQLRGTSAIHGLYIFNFYELIKIASEKRTENTIARLDSTHSYDDTPSSDWFIETKWDYDTQSNKDLFIICNLKIGSNDQIWSQKLQIILDQSRTRIQQGQITQLAGANNNSNTVTEQQRKRLKEITSKPPSPKRTGPEMSLRDTQNLKLTKHECEGESTIRMAYGNTNTVRIIQDTHISDDHTFEQYFFITHIIFSKKPTVLPEILHQKRSNAVEKPASVANLTVFYQVHDGSWRECQDVTIAPVTMQNEEPKWLTDTIINIEPDKLFSYTIKGRMQIKGEPGRDHQARARVHKSLPQPFKLKIVINDSFGKQCSLVVEQLNKPLDLITRDSFLKSNQSSINELLAFVYADDCETEERIYMAMYANKEHHLEISCNASSYFLTLELKTLRTMEFNAKKNQTPEVLLDQIHFQSSVQECKAISLFDSETYMFYGVRFEISTRSSKTEETIFVSVEKIK